MKTLLTLLCLLVGIYSQAQTAEQPRTEFTIGVSEDKVSLQPGQSKQVTVTVNRSQSYAKEKAYFGTMSSPTKGITVTYEPSEGKIDSSVASISAAADLPPGEYTIALSATLNHKKKGALVKLVVGNEAVAKH